MPQQIPRGRSGHVGDHPGPDGQEKRRGDVERDARRFRPTRSPAPRATSAAGAARRYGAGHYGRDLTVKAGRMSLKVPKLSGRRNGADNGSRTLPDRC